MASSILPGAYNPLPVKEKPVDHPHAVYAKVSLNRFEAKWANHMPYLNLRSVPKGSTLAPVTEANPVCIVGAGMAGLYVAMIFQSLGIPYKIIESNNRVGGRLYTHEFRKEVVVPGYDYYDVGAMRFPKTPLMWRTFDLVERKLPSGAVNFIQYTFSGRNTYYYLNGKELRSGATTAGSAQDPFGMEPYVGPSNIDICSPEGADNRITELLTEIIQDCNFAEDGTNLEDAINTLIEKYDRYSMRSYLQIVKNYSSEVINVLETFEDSTGSYDRALVETVCDFLAFNWIPKTNQPDWYCIDKGSSQLPTAMHRLLPVDRQAQLNTRVIAINTTTLPSGSTGLAVSYLNKDGSTQSKDFGAVIMTAPLSALNAIDLAGCGINDVYAQYSAIRSLQYGPSTKIAIQFSQNWWQSDGIIGGQSYTDLPIRTIVYPSYPQGDVTKSTTLIVSYCWTQDAERLGSLIDRVEPTVTPELLNIVLENLATVHNKNVDELRSMVVDHHAFSWQNDPNHQGAFGQFGPQQFSDLIYPYIRLPAANGQLYFAGEATSACHAWVAGALDSAWNSVSLFLNNYNYPTDTIDRFKSIWGHSETQRDGDH